MKYTALGRDGLVIFIYGLSWLILLSLLTGCSSFGCGNKIGEEYDRCKAKEVHDQMVKDGFYEAGGLRR